MVVYYQTSQHAYRLKNSMRASVHPLPVVNSERRSDSSYTDTDTDVSILRTASQNDEIMGALLTTAAYAPCRLHPCQHGTHSGRMGGVCEIIARGCLDVPSRTAQ